MRLAFFYVILNGVISNCLFPFSRDGFLSPYIRRKVWADGRKQVRRILKIIERLQKSNGIRIRDLANFYDVDITRIYEDLKIIKEFL